MNLLTNTNGLGLVTMDLSALKAFCTVVDSGSISKAARKLFMTQPALSVKIQRLEKYYQEPLLERTHKGIKPTESGIMLYRQGQKSLTILDNVKREIEKSRKPIKELVVGAASTIGNYALPCTVYVFSQRHPDFKISLGISNTENVIEKALSRTVELGLVEGPLSKSQQQSLAQEDIAIEVIDHNELSVIVPDHELFQDKKSVTLEELRKLPLILREKGSGIRNTIEFSLAAKGLRLQDFNVAVELNTIDAIKSSVIANKGISLLPKMALRKELRYKMLKTLTVDGIEFHHDFSLLYNNERTESTPYSAFLEFIQSQDRSFC